VRLSADGCDSFSLQEWLVESYDAEFHFFRSECSDLWEGHSYILDYGEARCRKGYRKKHDEKCVAEYCHAYRGASKRLRTQVKADIEWASIRSSGSPNAAWIAVAFSEPVEVDCIEVWQLRRGACPRMQVQSRDQNGKFSSWWEEKGWVYTEDPDSSALFVKSRILPTPIDTNLTSSETRVTYEIGPGVARGLLVGALASIAFLLFALLGAASCLGALLLLVSCELWYEVDYQHAALEPEKATTKAFGPETKLYSSPSPESYSASRDTLIRIKLVCHPRWLLGDGSLADLVQCICPDLHVLPLVEAHGAFPLEPLSRFEVVVRISGGEAALEIGRVMQMVVERRRSECAASLAGKHRQPRFQLIASTRWTFLHFGGNIGCGHRRWRSCPARFGTGGNFSISYSSRARTGSAHED